VGSLHSQDMAMGAPLHKFLDLLALGLRVGLTA
jgi:hypothetical protein